MTDRNVDRLRFSAAALLGSAGRQRPSLAPRRLGAGPTPWELGSPDSDRAPENHYPCMPLAQIEALQVPAADNAVLYLWALSSLLSEALRVMQCWGFSYRTSRVWVKHAAASSRTNASTVSSVTSSISRSYSRAL